ncbi:helix-turn-helix domain-containing protein [Prosthecobacter sp.]|jgi:transcriptional regulator with XRE-family HTH domain|uniref:helix-turn-helix domain-containing protein n=1 Tax=Prosthecobacter sp. TaxID=1965333 RepID=UPI0037846656
MSQRFRNILGPNIRKWRKKAGLSQDDLAARLQLAGLENIDRVAVAKIESQIRSLFDYELIVIGIALKVSPEEMIAVSDRSLRANLPTLCGARLKD